MRGSADGSSDAPSESLRRMPCRPRKPRSELISDSVIRDRLTDRGGSRFADLAIRNVPNTSRCLYNPARAKWLSSRAGCPGFAAGTTTWRAALSSSRLPTPLLLAADVRTCSGHPLRLASRAPEIPLVFKPFSPPRISRFLTAAYYFTPVLLSVRSRRWHRLHPEGSKCA